MLDRLTKKDVKELNAILAKAAAFEKKGMLAEAARSYRFFLSKRPEAVAFYNLGVTLKKMQHYHEAVLSYQNAIALRPDYAEAFVNIGSIFMERREFEASLEYYDNAVRRNPALVEAWYNRGVVLQELRRHDEALADYDRTLALQPRYYLAYLNKAVILYELKRKAEAARHYEQILRVDPGHIDANWNLGILRLSEGDFANGWRLSESRLKLHGAAHLGPEKPFLAGPDWAGKTVFLKWEQGFGDTIQFCRYALLVKAAGAKVVLSVQNPLRRLVRSLDDEIVVLGEDEFPENYDARALLMSLPHVFQTSIETIPYPTKYLRADATETAGWRTLLKGLSGPKVGIAWAGGARPDITCARRNDDNRSLTLQRFSLLIDMEKITFVSLQKGPAAEQLAGVGGVHDWTDQLADFAATAALVENLDLVITVDTAVAHLAAALGKPVWILIPWTSCWRWLEDRTDSPWYRSVRLFRQKERGNWDAVIAAVRRELANLRGESGWSG